MKNVAPAALLTANTAQNCRTVIFWGALKFATTISKIPRTNASTLASQKKSAKRLSTASLLRKLRLCSLNRLNLPVTLFRNTP